MIYCMSDLHGEQDRFTAMLERIQFSGGDTLYILGDVIDRHPGGVELLRQIMDTPNMVLLLGNHEQICLDTLGPDQVYGARELWQQNGGNSTYRELLYICSPPERRRILHFLARLPDHLDIEVNGRSFHLVHGFPAADRDSRIWGRPDDGGAPLPPFPDRTAIVGHTPTCFLTGNMDKPCAVWHGDGIIDIDCGCGSKDDHRRLACLRLDDMAEFYV